MKENYKNAEAYSLGEEIFNSISHGIGTGLSVAALVLLIVRAAVFSPKIERGFYVTGFCLFGAMLVILYAMSTFYHALTPRIAKKVFGIFDHSSIFLLIAGTYTPFCLGALRHQGGWWLFGIIWGLAAAGIALYAVFDKKVKKLSAVLYVIMGWLICLFWSALKTSVPQITTTFLLLGGIVYTVGVIFYAMKKVKWMHSVWHLFVLAGSVLHFFSIFWSI